MRTTSLPVRLALVVVATLTLAAGAAACGSDESAGVSSDGSTSEPVDRSTSTVEPSDPSTTEPPGPSDTVEPVDPDTPVSSPPGGGGDPIGEPPSDLEPIDAADAEVLVGLTLAEAEAEAAERGWTVRVARLDGEDLALTEDYSPTRVNVAVEGGVVTEIVSIG